jgi:hypothetical protein
MDNILYVLGAVRNRFGENGMNWMQAKTSANQLGLDLKKKKRKPLETLELHE